MFANLISLLRVLSLPAIIYAVVKSAWGFAIFIFLLAVLSDIVDAYIAKRLKETSKVGSFLDPFADKFLVLGLLLFFSIQEMFSFLFLSVFIFRDIIAAWLRLRASRDGVMIKSAKTYGKLVTYTHFAIIFSLLLISFTGGEPFFLFISISAALLISFLSIIHYTVSYVRGVSFLKGKGKKLEQENLIILTNRKSRGYRDRYRRHLLKRFARRRNAPIKSLPLGKNMFKGVNKVTKGFDHVIIAGGDGSFESALNNKTLAKKSLGFFPLGAGNAFYSHFYKGKRFEYLRKRFPFKEDEMDILEISYGKAKRETLFLSIGLDAEVIQMSSKHRSENHFWDYFKGSWKALFRARGDYELDCKIDDKKFNWDNCITLSFAKIPYFGFGIRSLLGEVDADDGKVYGLGVINTHSVFLNKIVRIWGLLLGMVNMNHFPLLPLRGKKVIIKSEVPFPIQAGGEFLGYSHKIEIKVKRKQKVLMI